MITKKTNAKENIRTIAMLLVYNLQNYYLKENCLFEDVAPYIISGP